VDVRQATETTRGKLAAAGWRTGPVEVGDGSDGILANFHFRARSSDVELDVYAYPDANGAPSITLTGWPARPASYVPLTVAGMLLGLVAGWSSGVALAHRIQAARRPQRSAGLAAAGVVLIVPSAIGFVASLAQGELVHQHGFAFGPTIELLRGLDLGEGWYLTPGDFEQLPIWGFALVAAAAILARPGRDRHAAQSRLFHSTG
jgi:hypothetical protein